MAMARAVVATACVDADDRAAKTTLTAHDAIDIAKKGTIFFAARGRGNHG